MLEISDLVVRWDRGERVPVHRDEVVARLRAAGDRRAARIVGRIPAPGGVLDPDAVDHLLVRVHTELQRLNEELHMPRRFAELHLPLLAAARSTGTTRPRVVDIGCGLGFLVRALAASGDLPDVDLVGVDFNPALVAEATRLAAEESLPCRFLVADAFALPEDATVYLSNGVLHHIAPADLPAFFAAQDRPGTRAFLHYDIAPTRLAPFGAWVFHRARMRAPLGRHDGVASARRAHPDPLLFAAAASAGMPTFRYGPLRHSNPFAAGMRAIIGTRDPAPFQDALGRRSRGLVPA